jgi:hypothetical protein
MLWYGPNISLVCKFLNGCYQSSRELHPSGTVSTHTS